MTLYSETEIQKMLEWYMQADGDLNVIHEGCLLSFGLAVFSGEGLKHAVVREKYLNEWSSAYTVRLYNKLPQKYA